MDSMNLATPDGICPVTLHTPEGQGPWPAVILYMDGPGLRPAVQDMAARLAQAGYAVFLPDLFYRSGAYAPVDPRKVFGDPALKEAHRARFMAPATPEAVMRDTAALLDLIASHPAARPGPVGVVGYCMGGRLALFAAGTFGDRIAAAASYHGGGLAVDAPSSPHHLAPQMRARLYVGGAIEDASFDDEQKARLIDALSSAGLPFTVETYPARHGWVPADTLAHDPAQAERHWQTLLALFAQSLPAGA